MKANVDIRTPGLGVSYRCSRRETERHGPLVWRQAGFTCQCIPGSGRHYTARMVTSLVRQRKRQS